MKSLDHPRGLLTPIRHGFKKPLGKFLKIDSGLADVMMSRYMGSDEFDYILLNLEVILNRQLYLDIVQ
jgi:hypothetical protein